MKNVVGYLGERIAWQRRLAGMSQAQLAEQVGVQPETISRIETGNQNISLGLVERVSEALQVELHELFRQPIGDDPRRRAIERLVWFCTRLSPAEIELTLKVGAAVIAHVRGPLPRGSPQRHPEPAEG